MPARACASERACMCARARACIPALATAVAIWSMHVRASQLTCAHRPRLHGAGRLQFWGPRRAVLLCTQPRRRMPVQALYLCHWSGRAILQGCATTDSARGGTNTSKEVGIPPACTCRAAELPAPAISGLPHESFFFSHAQHTCVLFECAPPGVPANPNGSSAHGVHCVVAGVAADRSSRSSGPSLHHATPDGIL